MARITVEDCLQQVDNRFRLIHLAAKRVRQLRKGAEPLVICKNKDVVTALREIAAGKVLQVHQPDRFLEADEMAIPTELPEPEELVAEEQTDDEAAAVEK